MTNVEEKKVLLLQIARELKGTSLTISSETADTLYNLISRQKAEIESLNKQLVFEIESAYDRGTKAAIRGFAENLKLKADKECVRELASYGNYWGRSMIIPKDSEVYVASYKISEADLDELVKEMTEGENG